MFESIWSFTANSDALADPQIELIQQISDFHTTKTTLAWNDDYNVDYDDGTTQTANTASDIPDYLNTLITKRSAIVITLPEGDYSAKSKRCWWNQWHRKSWPRQSYRVNINYSICLIVVLNSEGKFCVTTSSMVSSWLP